MLILIIYNAQEIFDYFINKFRIILIFNFLKCYTYVLPCYVSETFAVSCIYYGYKLYEHYNCIVLLIQLAVNNTRSFDEINWTETNSEILRRIEIYLLLNVGNDLIKTYRDRINSKLMRFIKSNLSRKPLLAGSQKLKTSIDVTA